MPLELALATHLDINLSQEFQNGKMFEIIGYWERQPHLKASMDIHGRKETVEYVFAPQSFLNYLDPKEKFGVYLGNMMFINSKLAQEHPEYVPYIVLKLFSEKFIDEGKDTSGRAVHWQSLYGTIRVAGQLMDEQQMYGFLKELGKHESSGFFKLDGQVREFMDKMGDGSRTLLEEKRQYLQKHHDNRWVKAGRFEESLAELGFRFDGNRNHAEAIMSCIRNLDITHMYQATAFVHAMISVNTNTSILVTPPYTSFAYAMTKDGNGLVDLVRFLASNQMEHNSDTIIKLPNREKTWGALSKRLQYNMHRAEEQVMQLMDKHKAELDNIAIEAESHSHKLAQEVLQIQALLKNQQYFAQATARLQNIPGVRKQLERLNDASASIAESLSLLNGASQALLQQIN